MSVREEVKLIELLKGKRVAIVGVGNRLRGDDGVGSVIAGQLQSSTGEGVRVIDAETVPENYLGVLLDLKPEIVLFVDAADFGGRAGDWTLVQLSALGDKVPSTHTVSLKLLGQILESNGIECLLLVIQPERTGFGLPMSEAVASTAEKVTRMLAQILNSPALPSAEMSRGGAGDE